MSQNNLLNGIIIFFIILIIIQMIIKTFTAKIEYFVEISPENYPGFQYVKDTDIFFLNPPAESDPRTGIISGAKQVKYDCDPNDQTMCKFDYLY